MQEHTSMGTSSGVGLNRPSGPAVGVALPGQQDAALDPELVSTLQGWRLARERAGRYNRNVLQYGAGVTAVLGVGLGSSGVFEVAQSMAVLRNQGEGIPSWTNSVLAATIAISAVLVFLLMAAFWHRRAAETAADACLTRLIALAPDRFWSREE